MREEYRKLFDEVCASKRLRTEVLQMREQQNNHTRRRLISGAMLAAVLAALVLAGTALAAFGGLGEWFAREWGSATGKEISEAQAQIIDSLTQKVGVSEVVDGVTLTVDSLTVGSENLWVLLKAEGLDFSEQKLYDFTGMDFEIQPDPGPSMSSYGIVHEAVREDGSLTILMVYSTLVPSGQQLNEGGYTLELTLDALAEATKAGAGAAEPLHKGTWHFSIPLTVESLSPVVEIPGMIRVTAEKIPDAADQPDQAEGEDGVTPEGGEALPEEGFTLWEIHLTATGLFYRTEQGCDLEAALVLRDGTEVRSNGGSGSRQEDGTWYASHQWPVPIDLEDVAALRLGDREIPLT